MKKLIKEINKHNYNYYTLGKPTIPDYEYDKLYDRLVEMEKEQGIIYANSPTQRVGFELKKELTKNTLQYPLRSLDKTKDIEELKQFIGNEQVVVMIKCDGLTNEITYKESFISTGTTRGNGEVGELITDNVKNYQNVPLRSPIGNMVVVGEAVIMKDDFLNINTKLKEEDKFANPRNLVSGSVRQLNPNITKNRKVSFVAFGMNGMEGIYTKKSEELGILAERGFSVVPNLVCYKDNVEQCIKELKAYAEEVGIPYDGMVVQYNDLSLKEKLGSTSKFPRWAKAFKFTDEECETTLKSIEYNASRNGVLTPVAVFDPVDLEGTEVEKASLHNLSIMKELQLGLGDEIVVFKANQIIPQVARNNTKSNTLEPITECPYCKHKTVIKGDFLYCSNDNCSCRVTNKIAHFCSRNAMNIAGFSEKTIEKLLNLELISDVLSIYELHLFKDKLYRIEGMGKKSIDKLLDNIEKSKNVKAFNFLYALGIPQIGLSTAKAVCKSIDIKEILSLSLDKFRSIDGLGDVAAHKLYDFLCEEEELIFELLEVMNFDEENEPEVVSGVYLTGKTFVITGSVNIFKNRNEIKDRIEQLGGKVASGVTKKTDYLINNDKESSSSKNKKAKELEVPIIGEEEFIKLIG